MRPLTANLKFLYQHRLIWLYDVMIVIGILTTFGSTSSHPEVDSVILTRSILFLLAGQMMGMMVISTLSKPFAFCLPRHRMTAKRMLLAIWAATLTLCILLLSLRWAAGAKIGHQIVIGALGIMSLFFWIGASGCIYKTRLLMFPFLLVYVFSMIFSKAQMIENFIFSHPWIVTLFVIFFISGLYHAIDRRSNARNWCETPWAGALGASKAKQDSIKRELMRRKEYAPPGKFIEFCTHFFIKRIISNRSSEKMPHFWGQLYTALTPMMVVWESTLAGGLVIFGFCFFIQLLGPEPFIPDLLLFIFAGLLAAVICTAPRFTPCLPISRKAYFHRGLALVVTAILMSSVFMGVSVFLINLASFLFPTAVILGKTFALSPIRWMLLAVPIIVIPLFGGVFILMRQVVTRILTTILALIGVFTLSCLSAAVLEHASIIVFLAIVIPSMVFTCGFYKVALYFDSMKRSLC